MFRENGNSNIREKLIHGGNHPSHAPIFGINLAKLFDALKRENDTGVGTETLNHIDVVEPIGLKAFLVECLDVISLHGGFSEQLPVRIIGVFALIEIRLLLRK